MPGQRERWNLGAFRNMGQKPLKQPGGTWGSWFWEVSSQTLKLRPRAGLSSEDAWAVGAAQCPQDIPAATAAHPADRDPWSALFWGSPQPSPAGICNCGAAAGGGELGALAMSAHSPPLLPGDEN